MTVLKVTLRWHWAKYLFCFLILLCNSEARAADNAQLLSVSIPLGAQIPPRTMFTQTWTFTNTGTTTWTNGFSYTLNIISNDTMGALSLFTNTSPQRYITSAILNQNQKIPPGGIGSFSMGFIAPEAPGTYTDTFQLNNAKSAYFGPQVTVQITVPAVGSTNQYDRSRAVTYANNYVGIVCSDGYFWTNGSTCVYYGVGSPVPTSVIGDDCAHFVSCCIGNQPAMRGGGLNVPSRTESYGEPGAQRLLYTVLVGGGYATEVYSLSRMEPGDVVGWNWEGNPSTNEIDHVTLYMGNGLVAAHAASHLDMSMSYYISSYPSVAYHLIHIYDAPTLASQRIGTKLVLSWGTNWTGYSLYASTSLGSGAAWNKVSKSPVIIGNSNFVTNAMTGNRLFYRLSMP